MCRRHLLCGTVLGATSLHTRRRVGRRGPGSARRRGARPGPFPPRAPWGKPGAGRPLSTIHHRLSSERRLESFHAVRSRFDRRMNPPLRVPTSRATEPVAAVVVDIFLLLLYWLGVYRIQVSDFPILLTESGDWNLLCSLRCLLACSYLLYQVQ